VTFPRCFFSIIIFFNLRISLPRVSSLQISRVTFCLRFCSLPLLVPIQPISPSLIIHINGIGRRVNMLMNLTGSFLMLSVTSPLGPDIVLRPLIWNILSTSFVREEVSHQHKTTGKIKQFCIFFSFHVFLI
jgi:hypothetical protein